MPNFGRVKNYMHCCTSTRQTVYSETLNVTEDQITVAMILFYATNILTVSNVFFVFVIFSMAVEMRINFRGGGGLNFGH